MLFIEECNVSDVPLAWLKHIHCITEVLKLISHASKNCQVNHHSWGGPNIVRNVPEKEMDKVRQRLESWKDSIKLETFCISPWMKAWFAFFYYQCGSQTSKEWFKQVVRSFDGLAKKLQLWLSLKFKMLLRPFRMLWPKSLQAVWIDSNFWLNYSPRLAVASLHG